MKYCKFCGKEMKDEAVFCKFCGKSTAENTSSTKNRSELMDAVKNNAAKGFDSVKKNTVKTYQQTKNYTKEVWEDNSQHDGEFRIFKSPLRWICLLLIFPVVVLCIITIMSEFWDYCFPNAIPLSVAMLNLLLVIFGAKKNYLSDTKIYFALKVVGGIIALIVSAPVLFGGRRDWYYILPISISIIILGIIAGIIFGLMMSKKEGKFKNMLLITAILQVVCSLIILFMSFINSVDAIASYGGKDSDRYWYCLPAVAFVLFSIFELLFVLMISNKPGYEYVSLKEPDGKHIRTRNIPFMILMSFITVGIYGFIWLWSMMASIRKLEKRNSFVLGEWICFDLFFPYRWYWLYTRAKKLSVISTNNRIATTGGGGIYIFLDIMLLGIVNFAMIQSNLNQLAVVMGKNGFVYGTEIMSTPSGGSIPAQTKTPDPAPVSAADEIKKYKELLDMGAITQEEFNKKKEQLL